MNAPEPYKASGQPGHPGVQGKPFGPSDPVSEKSSPETLPGNVDPTGTGTFPPEEQGNVGRAQPAGLSAATEYGVGTADQGVGGHHVANPVTHPHGHTDPAPPSEEEEEDVPFDEQG